MDRLQLTGVRLGQYHIRQQLGAGGVGAVYLADQPALNRQVAIKVLMPAAAADAEFVSRFRREGTLVAGMMHPNILPVYDFGEQDGYLYLVMAYIPGGTLAETMEEPMDVPTAIRIIKGIATGLEHAHSRGVVHRDLKPANIFMGGDDYPLIGDFGIARLIAESNLTISGTAIGTPRYMSPEQALGNPVDGRSDLYSLGIILYELVTGRAPFLGEHSLAILNQHVTVPPPPPTRFRPDLPKALEQVILKSLAKKPGDRYQTAAEFRTALDNVQTAGLTGIHFHLPHVSLTDAITTITSPNKAVRRWLNSWTITAAVLLLALASGGLFFAGAFNQGPAPGSKGVVKIGTTNFSEQVLLGEVYGQALEANGYRVERLFNLGNRDVIAPAVESGLVDMTIEYLTSYLEYLNRGTGEASADPAATHRALQAQLTKRNLTVLNYAEAFNTNGFVVTPETASRIGLASLSDLSKANSQLILGGPPECPRRDLCLRGLETIYSLRFKEFRPLDAGGPLTIAALDAGQIDVGLLFTTDANIETKGYVLLQDDKHWQLAENIAPVVRNQKLEQGGNDLRAVINDVTAKLSLEDLIAMNKQMTLDQKSPSAVANAWLKNHRLIR